MYQVKICPSFRKKKITFSLITNKIFETARIRLNVKSNHSKPSQHLHEAKIRETFHYYQTIEKSLDSLILV